MKILISGASGLVGTAASKGLRAGGHAVSHLVRPGKPAGAGDVTWDPMAATVDLAALEGVEAILHLSGASIADGRWTNDRKRILRSSRLGSTRVLVDALAKLQRKPRVFLAASAIGYYGNRGDEVLTEKSSNGHDFLAQLTRDWEAESLRAQEAGMRTVLLRFGIILSTHGGALAKMLTPFKFGVGGKLGSGRQWMSWVAIQDVVGAIRAALADERLTGPVNIVAPKPVQNADFTRGLALAVRRPAMLPAPAFMLRAAMGEMANELLLTSQRVRPEKLLGSGFKFEYEDLESALRAIVVEGDY